MQGHLHASLGWDMHPPGGSCWLATATERMPDACCTHIAGGRRPCRRGMLHVLTHQASHCTVGRSKRSAVQVGRQMLERHGEQPSVALTIRFFRFYYCSSFNSLSTLQ